MSRGEIPQPTAPVSVLFRPGTAADRRAVPLPPPLSQAPHEYTPAELAMHRVAALPGDEAVMQAWHTACANNDADPDAVLPGYSSGFDAGERVGYVHGWVWGGIAGGLLVGIAGGLLHAYLR